MTEIYDFNGVPWTNEPWLPYQAKDFIYRIIKPKKVFEWGMGGSTLFFLRLGVKMIVSVESDQSWYREVMSKVATDSYKTIYPTTKHYPYCVPYEEGEIGSDKSEPSHYKSGSTVLGAVNFKKYANMINVTSGLCKKYDLILIDGMARPSCIVAAAPYVKSGGWLVIDNTGDRPYYLEKTAYLFGDWEDGWERIDITGYGPILAYKWTTTFFHNVKKAHYE